MSCRTLEYIVSFLYWFLHFQIDTVADILIYSVHYYSMADVKTIIN